MAGENWTMWLNITNCALGLVTLVALARRIFRGGLGSCTFEKLGRARARFDLSNIDDELQALLHGGSHSLVRTRTGADDG